MCCEASASHLRFHLWTNSPEIDDLYQQTSKNGRDHSFWQKSRHQENFSWEASRLKWYKCKSVHRQPSVKSMTSTILILTLKSILRTFFKFLMTVVSLVGWRFWRQKMSNETFKMEHFYEPFYNTICILFLWPKSCNVSHVVGVEVLQTYSLLSCAGVWLSQHYYAIATVIIYKSN